MREAVTGRIADGTIVSTKRRPASLPALRPAPLASPALSALLSSTGKYSLCLYFHVTRSGRVRAEQTEGKSCLHAPPPVTDSAHGSWTLQAASDSPCSASVMSARRLTDRINKPLDGNLQTREYNQLKSGAD